ncbi:hypothetical protein HNP49_002344 [Pseudomonas fluvialis]|uniref:Uncharacterized protein n=1 Tax=Pseudomonas fluvialis TaxID=1793966 RepID=A0A7X0BSP2_9PSED|nr:hypothetical protein [Pseudomonas fluvialis]
MSDGFERCLQVSHVVLQILALGDLNVEIQQVCT